MSDELGGHDVVFTAVDSKCSDVDSLANGFDGVVVVEARSVTGCADAAAGLEAPAAQRKPSGHAVGLEARAGQKLPCVHSVSTPAPARQ